MTLKRILKHPRTQSALSWVLAQYIRLVYITCRKRYHIHPEAVPYMHGEENAIFAFWHGRMMMCPTLEPRGRKMHVLISFHRDGLLISKTIAHFGEATISGSSSKGGSAALEDMLRVLKKGDNVSITPDGPRGPVHEAQKGIVIAAKLSGKPIIPVSFAASRHRHMHSWDRFTVALPFGRIAYCAEAPIHVTRDADETAEEHFRIAVEKGLNDMTAKAEYLANGGTRRHEEERPTKHCRSHNENEAI